MYNEELNKQQRYDEHGGCFTALSVMFVLFAIVVLVCLFGSCKTNQRVTEKVVYRDSIIKQTEYLRDSVYITDSTRIQEKGDTVLIDRLIKVYKDRWRDRTDTIYINKGDNITETIVKEVVPKWCYWLLVVVCGYVVFRVVKWKLK